LFRTSAYLSSKYFLWPLPSKPAASSRSKERMMKDENKEQTKMKFFAYQEAASKSVRPTCFPAINAWWLLRVSAY